MCLNNKSVYYTMNREDLLSKIASNESVLIVFVTATWCAPCQIIKPYIMSKFKETEYEYICLDADADADCFSALKAKKQIKGVPSLLGYVKGNKSIGADICISGTNTNEIDCFFESLCFL